MNGAPFVWSSFNGAISSEAMVSAISPDLKQMRMVMHKTFLQCACLLKTYGQRVTEAKSKLALDKKEEKFREKVLSSGGRRGEDLLPMLEEAQGAGGELLPLVRDGGSGR